MRRPWPLLLVATSVALAVVARAELYGSTFRSAAWGVELTVPRGWELSEQQSYPGIIARGVERRGGARVSLAAEFLAEGETVRTALARSERALKKTGYTVAPTSSHPFGAMLLEAITPDRKRVVRQGYVAQNGVLYVLSVATPAADGQRYVHTFDEMLRSLRFSTPAGAPAAAGRDAGADAPPARSP